MNSNPALSLSSLPTLLQPGALLSLESVPGLRISVMSGRVWLTEELDADDHFIGAGRHHTVVGSGRVVLEVDGPAAVRLACTWAVRTEPADAVRPAESAPACP
jgi:Protein of unknown function (DUF2917)